MDLSTMGLLAAAADVSSISMDQKVPIMTIICILLSLVLCIGVPIAFFILIRRRIRMVGQAVIFGVLVYMLASSVLVQFTYILIVMMPGAESLLETNRPLSAIVSVAVTALYEVLGFYLGLKLLKRTVERPRSEIGHGVRSFVLFGLYSSSCHRRILRQLAAVFDGGHIHQRYRDAGFGRGRSRRG